MLVETNRQLALRFLKGLQSSRPTNDSKIIIFIKPYDNIDIKAPNRSARTRSPPFEWLLIMTVSKDGLQLT